jgi:chloramphenicol 3-O phosphotransferase
VIVLNGTASSGKSSVAFALQEVMPEPYLEIGLDRFLGALPRRYFERPLWDDVLGRWTKAGSVGLQLVAAMHRSLATIAAGGMNVVADHVLVSSEWAADLASAMNDVRAYLVGVRCDLETVVARERDRGDRTLGEAELQYPLVHRHGPYDVEVDTAVLSPTEAARAIVDHVASTAPMALGTLRTPRG